MDDGGILLTASGAADSAIIAWDVRTGTVLTRYTTNASPRNGLVAVGVTHFMAAQVGKGALHTWAYRKEHPLHRSFTHEPLAAMAATPDGCFIIGGGASGTAYAWEAATGRLLRTWPAGYKSLTAVAVTDDGSLLLTAGEDTALACWSLLSLLDAGADAESGSVAPPPASPLWSRCEHTLGVTAVAPGTGGAAALVATASLDRTAKLWAVADGCVLATVRYPTFLLAVAWGAAEHVLYAAGGEGRIFATPTAAAAGAGASGCDATTPESGAFAGHTRPVTSLALGLDGDTLASGSDDGTARLWDARSGQSLRSFAAGAGGAVTTVLLIPTPEGLAGVAGTGGVGEGGRKRPAPPVAQLQKYASPGSGPRPWEGPPVACGEAAPATPGFISVESVLVGQGVGWAIGQDAAPALMWDTSAPGWGHPAEPGRGDQPDLAAEVARLRSELETAQGDARRWEGLYAMLKS